LHLEGHITALFASVLQYVLAERQHDAEKCQAVFSDKRAPFVQTSCSISLI
jgi:hypothetical protein